MACKRFQSTWLYMDISLLVNLRKPADYCFLRIHFVHFSRTFCKDNWKLQGVFHHFIPLVIFKARVKLNNFVVKKLKTFGRTRYDVIMRKHRKLWRINGCKWTLKTTFNLAHINTQIARINFLFYHLCLQLSLFYANYFFLIFTRKLISITIFKTLYF